MATVLWGKRRGDVQYASRDYWRRTIPIGDMRLEVESNAYFDVGTPFEFQSGDGRIYRVTGKEPQMLGVRAA